MEQNSLKVRVAKDYLTRLVGLMGKSKWSNGYQALYFPACRSVHTFFTFLRPDLLFLDKNNKILRVYHSAKPWLVFIGPAHTYGCLELPQGTAQQLGLLEGETITWPFQ
jgi:uncharacterized membrane protein (UPF0127 family)